MRSNVKIERNNEIVSKYELGHTSTELAKDYGISRQRVFQILQEAGYRRGEKFVPIALVDRRAKIIFQFILDFKLNNDGLSPTVHEICKTCTPHFIYSSVIYALHFLEDEGKIKRLGHRIMLIGGKYVYDVEER